MQRIYEIDFVLFLEHDMPPFDLRSAKRKTKDLSLPQRPYSLPSSQPNWNKLDRITSMMFPKLIKSEYDTFMTEETNYQIFTQKVNGNNYKFEITQAMPIFTPIPMSIEIFQRIILRATLCNSVVEFSFQNYQ